MSNIDGTGNAGHGIYLTDGGTAKITTCSITGTSGDVRVGASGTVAYASLPANDFAAGATAEGCRAW